MVVPEKELWFTQQSILTIRSAREGTERDPAKSTRTTHKTRGIIEVNYLVKPYMLDARWSITRYGSWLSRTPSC